MASYVLHQSVLGGEDLLTLLRAKRGDPRAVERILKIYKPIVEAKAKGFFLPGAEFDDVIQEGMLGLFKAIRDYKLESSTPFRPFAELCVLRQIITALKTATRQKHLPLNSSVGFYHSEHDSDVNLLDILPDPSAPNPEEILFPPKHQHSSSLFRLLLKRLSSYERLVLQRYMEGKRYKEIAEELGRSEKSIDNALQRIKKKAAQLLGN
jgi:RNA polymerase sporulation-specific sigma factor